MSDSEGDLGGYGPTSPAPPRMSKLAMKTKPSTSSQYDNPIEIDDSEEGPAIDVDSESGGDPSTSNRRRGGSRRPPNNNSRAATSVRKPPSSSARTRQKTNGKQPSHSNSKPTSANANGMTTAKGKGTTLVSKSSRRQQQQLNVDTEVEQQDDVADVDLDDEGRESEHESFPNDATNALISYAIAGSSGGRAGSHSRLSKQQDPSPRVKRLEQQVEKLQANCKAFQEQLRQLVELRETEPELQIQKIHESYEGQLASKDLLIQDLIRQVQRWEMLQRDGAESVLNLVTRTAADASKREAEDEIERLRAVIEDDKIKAREGEVRVGELENELKEARYELKLLRERVEKTESAKPATPLKKKVLDQIEQPKHAVVIGFYEELTSVLVTSARRQPPKYLDKEEWSLTCIITGDKFRSLNFQLRMAWDLSQGESEPVHSDSQLTPTVHYSPLHLDKESEDFCTRLDFLNTDFTFTREQLSVFLTTLKTTLEGTVDEEEDSSKEVIVVDD